MSTRLVYLPAVALLTCTGVAVAQDKPSGLVQQKAATSGSTDVATQGFEAAVKPPAEKTTDATELSVSAGGILAAGNSRSVAATAAEQFRLRREASQLSIAASANYGRSAPDATSAMKTTVENFQGRLRYDYFVTERFALFMAVSGRHDRFQGLDLRLNFSPGVAYYFVEEEKQRLWGELGYDLQHDIRSSDAIAVALAAGDTIDKSETRHNGRLFLGYDNKLNDAVTFNTGVEYLLGLSPFKDDATNRMNWRLNWDAGMTAKVSDKFSFATTMGVRYDNNPLPGKRRTDAITAVNLVYSLL